MHETEGTEQQAEKMGEKVPDVAQEPALVVPAPASTAPQTAEVPKAKAPKKVRPAKAATGERKAPKDVKIPKTDRPTRKLVREVNKKLRESKKARRPAHPPKRDARKSHPAPKRDGKEFYRNIGKRPRKTTKPEPSSKLVRVSVEGIAQLKKLAKKHDCSIGEVVLKGIAKLR